MIAIYSNRINCNSGIFQDVSLPIDLQMQLIEIRPLLKSAFQTMTYYQFKIDNDSITLIDKGSATSKMLNVIPQPTIQLLNSIMKKVANL